MAFHADEAVLSAIQEPVGQRENYWSLVPPGMYNGIAANELLRCYASILERDLAHALRDNSIAYYLHLYRRLAPFSIGNNIEPATILNVRATLEAAIHKYAMPGMCERVGDSSAVGLEGILNGALKQCNPPSEYLDALIAKPQLVLTDFGPVQLAAFYRLERNSHTRFGGRQRSCAR